MTVAVSQHSDARWYWTSGSDSSDAGYWSAGKAREAFDTWQWEQNNPTPPSGLILTSPDNTKYRVVVDDDGTLTTEAV